jgi:hypothetical protein
MAQCGRAGWFSEIDTYRHARGMQVSDDFLVVGDRRTPVFRSRFFGLDVAVSAIPEKLVAKEQIALP